MSSTGLKGKFLGSVLAMASGISYSQTLPAQNLSNGWLAEPRAVLNLQKAAAEVEREAFWGHSKGLSATINQLVPYQAHTSADGFTSTRFQHFYKGLEVVGSVGIHTSREKQSWVNNQIKAFDLDVNPSVSDAEALALTRSFNPSAGFKTQPTLKVWPRQGSDTARLVYVAQFATQGLGGEGDEIVIDAHTGQLVAELSRYVEAVEPAGYQITSAQKRGLLVSPRIEVDSASKPQLKDCTVENLKTGLKTILAKDSCVAFFSGVSPLLSSKTECQVISGLNGFPMVLNAPVCKPVADQKQVLDSVDASVLRAKANTEKALAYYREHHSRNGFDDKGTKVQSIIHAGSSMANAFWDTQLNLMAYGDGDGEEMGDLTLGADVAGHEMTHGVVTATANLRSLDQAGALNEAVADYFGSLIEGKNNWIMGEEVYLTAKDGTRPRGLRDLEDPTSLVHRVENGKGEKVEAAYPAHLKDAMKLENPDAACTRKNDRCWVHHNSTVFSHAAYLINKALGQTLAEKVLFTALTQNMGPAETFATAGKAVRLAAEQLELSPGDQAKVNASLEAVGI